MSKTSFRDTNMQTVDDLIKSIEKALNFLEQIRVSQNFYSTSGFITDDQDCATTFFNTCESFRTQLNTYLTVIKTNKTIMENNSGWAGE